jgi:hypothetical protein
MNILNSSPPQYFTRQFDSSEVFQVALFLGTIPGTFLLRNIPDSSAPQNYSRQICFSGLF